MKTEYQMVRDFMRAFGQNVPDTVRMPDKAIERLRDDLIHEERIELYTSGDPVEKLDAICDLLYVVQIGRAHV